jgi:molybdopterin converting factor small subunit
MPVLHVPASMRRLTDGRERFEVTGASLRDVIAALEDVCPRLTERLVQDGELRPDIAIAIDGSVIEDSGLYQPLAADAEIFLVPPLGGG